MVCQGFLAPAKIDPRMLDPKHVFSEVEQAKKIDIFAPEKKRRARDGYEEGNYTQHKTCPVSAFVTSDEYLDLLATHNQIVFDDASADLVIPFPIASISRSQTARSHFENQKRVMLFRIHWRPTPPNNLLTSSSIARDTIQSFVNALIASRLTFYFRHATQQQRKRYGCSWPI